MTPRRLATLFTPRTFAVRTLGQELDAIKAGDKPLSFFSSVRSVVEDGSDLIDIMRAAFDRELSVALVPHDGRGVDILVFETKHSARVAQYRAFASKKRTRWTFADEEQQGRLLGYSARERAAWMARERATHIEYGMCTMYALVDDTQRAQLARGKRRFDGVDRVFVTTSFGAVFPSARAKLPRGLSLVRFGVDWKQARPLVGLSSTRIGSMQRIRYATGGPVVEIELGNAQRRAIVEGLRAGPQVLGPRGWTRLSSRSPTA